MNYYSMRHKQRIQRRNSKRDLTNSLIAYAVCVAIMALVIWVSINTPLPR